MSEENIQPIELEVDAAAPAPIEVEPTPVEVVPEPEPVVVVVPEPEPDGRGHEIRRLLRPVVPGAGRAGTRAPQRLSPFYVLRGP